MEELRIVKRDGREMDFNPAKIEKAVFKALVAIGMETVEAEETAYNITGKVVNKIRLEYVTENPTVEQVQDMVVKVLLEEGLEVASKAYTVYRAERTRAREMKGSLMKVIDQLTSADPGEVDLKRENANIDGDTAMGTMLRYGSETAKHFVHMSELDKEASEAHTSGDIHIHDLDFYTLTMTCVQIDLARLFKNGFGTGHGIIREPNDIMSYSALACIAIQSSQNDMHGGQSIPALDYYLAPGVLKTFKKRLFSNLTKSMMFGYRLSELTTSRIVRFMNEVNKRIVSIDLDENIIESIVMGLEKGLIEETDTNPNLEEVRAMVDLSIKLSFEETDKQTYQAMEALVHNLNTMQSRAGSQVPFSSVNYGTDTSTEGRMVMKNLLLTTEHGLGNNETPIFPIQIFKVKEGINLNEGDPNYDLFKLACRVSTKRLFPNFSFLDAPYNLAYYKEGNPDTEVAYMGCRTRVMANENDKTKEIVTGRGNLSFTSINLPRIAMTVGKGELTQFFEVLRDRMDLVVTQLEKRFRLQGNKKVKNFPFLMGQGIWLDSENLDSEETIAEIIKHGTLSIGFIGLAEALKFLVGKHHGEDDEAQKLGLEIIGFMRDYLDELAIETGLNFSLLATPAEGLSGRFVKIDKKKFGEIEGVTDREYYTNSFHVPVHYDIKMYKKIDIEAPYHALTNAGHISYVELDGDASNNPEAFENLIKYMAKSGMGYGSINHPVDRDPVCGFVGVINDECPGCGRKEEDGGPRFDRIRRITGYLVGTLDRFNDAKKAEERERVKHGR